ncbi:CotH kinase family protein [Ruminococcus sp.]|uniref:CotH kinase family protein n=1 Tax=Ruminococcus sp. TaxID=41978 RepID=UPI0025FC26B5|nr:CotH kinase family protein [Ruminococcus sp.]MBQ8967134.1 CotH kinase family protein [Ruminococcus sp.]
MKNKTRLIAFMLAVLTLASCSASGGTDKGTASSESKTAAETSAENEAEEGKGAPASVGFSSPSGIYPAGLEVTLSPAEEGEVYYTLDGSDPTTSETAVKYESPIAVTDRKGDKNVVSAVDPLLIAGTFNEPNNDKNGFVSTVSAPEDSAVDKCTAIRAAVKRPDGSFGAIANASYFIGTAEEHIQGLAESCKAAGHDLAVISLSMEYDDLFDSTKGIYVKGDIFEAEMEKFLSVKRNKINDPEQARSMDANYKQRGKEWERRASVSFMEFSTDGAEEKFSQDCGVRIQGNYSRSDLQKGFRLYARSDYGDNNFRYAVFGEDYTNDSGEVMDKFDTLVLRAGGNCAFTAKFNDTYWQSLVHESACDTKHSRPCVVYLNGEYWGLYVLEEDYSNDFFEDVHGVDKSQVIVYKGDAETYRSGYKLDEGDVPEGEKEDYYFKELTDFFASHKDASSDEDYAALTALVDPESVRDYFAIECWINNKWDWPGKNWSMWRTAEVDPENPYADGRFRYMIYDVEFGGVSGKSDASTNTIKEDNYKPKGLLDMDTNNPAVLCFAYLMTNEGFRNDFYDRLNGLSAGEFEKSAALEKLRAFEDEYSPLYDQFFERYPGTGSTDNAVNGGYASIQCIRDFLEKRSDNISKQIDYCEKTLSE